MKKTIIAFTILILLIFASLLGWKNANDKGNNYLEDSYDVIVIGGEPEGVAAAVSAARNGAKTLLVEKRESLGGLFTYGMLNFLDIPQGQNGYSVSKGIFEEWHELVGGGNAFGIEKAKDSFAELVNEEPNLTLLTETKIENVQLNENEIISVKIKNKDVERVIEGSSFIDATQDADFAVMSKTPYFIGGEDINIEETSMAVTLMIHLENVDWKKIQETAESEKFGAAEVTDHVAWGFTKLHHEYHPVEANTRLRGLNLGKVEDEYFINALQIFGVNGLDEQSKQDAIEKGKRETQHILTFLQDEFPGFENAKIRSYPEELYVRETRHMEAEYQLPMSDVWMNKNHSDLIALGAYPVDIQATSIDNYGHVLSSPKQYAIPFRSIIPKEIDGLLVVGRSAGYSSLAAGSARVVPTGMAVGEAAGAAAAIQVREKISFRDMSEKKDLIIQLQETLIEQGAYLEQFELDYPYQGEWFDEHIQTLMDYGLAYGGYDNDLKVDEVVSLASFIIVLEGIIERVDPIIAKNYGEKVVEVQSKMNGEMGELLRTEDVVAIIGEVLFEENADVTLEMLIKEEVIDERLGSRLQESGQFTYKELYGVGASLIDYIKK